MPPSGIGRRQRESSGSISPNWPAYSPAKSAVERGLRRVVDHELGLEAIERVVGGEGARGLAQLVGLGNVLGIVDDDMRAAHEGQRVVDRLGLGARHAVGHLQQLEARIAEQPLDRRDRLRALRSSTTKSTCSFSRG